MMGLRLSELLRAFSLPVMVAGQEVVCTPFESPPALTAGGLLLPACVDHSADMHLNWSAHCE